MKLKDLLLGRKVMTNLDSIFKSRSITLPTKVRLVKVMVFSVVMYGCESWTVKKAEWWRIDAFELWCWRRLFRVPWTERRSNQSILKEISPEISLEEWCWSWNSSTLATSCEELTHWKGLWCWEGLGAGGEGDDRGWDGWMASLTLWTWVWMNSRSWWWTVRPGMLRFMGSRRVRHDWATELNWTVVFHLGFILFGTLWVSWTWVTISFPMLGKFSTLIFSSIFSWPFFLSYYSAIPMVQIFGHLPLPQRSLRLSSFLLLIFSSLPHLFLPFYLLPHLS